MGRSEPYGCYSRKLGRAVTPQQNTQMTVTLPITQKALLETLQLSRYEATQQGKPCRARGSGLQREAFPLSNCTTEQNWRDFVRGKIKTRIFARGRLKQKGQRKKRQSDETWYRKGEKPTAKQPRNTPSRDRAIKGIRRPLRRHTSG